MVGMQHDQHAYEESTTYTLYLYYKLQIFARGRCEIGDIVLDPRSLEPRYIITIEGTGDVTTLFSFPKTGGHGRQWPVFCFWYKYAVS